MCLTKTEVQDGHSAFEVILRYIEARNMAVRAVQLGFSEIQIDDENFHSVRNAPECKRTCDPNGVGMLHLCAELSRFCS